MDFEDELKQDFLSEAQQNLDECEGIFLELEQNPDQEEKINQIFRLAHNIKGTSRAVGLGDIAEFTHVFETFILKIKNGEINTSPEAVSLLLEANDIVRHMVSTLCDDLDATFDNAEPIAKLENFIASEMAGDTPKDDGDQTAEPPEAPKPPELDQSPEDMQASGAEEAISAEVDLAELDLSEINDIASAFEAEADETSADDFLSEDNGEEADASSPVPITEPPAPDVPKMDPTAQKATPSPTPPAAAPKKVKKVEETLRVSLDRLDNLNNLVGELVILQSVLRQTEGISITAPYAKNLTQLTKLSKEIHETTMSLRMVSIKNTLQKMQRIVRDTTSALGKKVQLHLQGEDNEIDKTVLEQLADPLVHLVRNAVDHGIESPEERAKSGKPETGTVWIRCYHEGNFLVVEVTDDGSGIDPRKILNKAIEKGVVSENARLSEQEALNLVFEPSFSTKAEVSEVSGRGVGMDVVRTNVRKINGDVTVSSKIGEGSVFRITLPLTMAVIEGLIGKVGDHKFVFPLSQVHETLQFDRKLVDNVTNCGEVFDLRGETIPLHRLDQTLNLHPINTEGRSVQDQYGTVVVSRMKEKFFGVYVDNILNQQQVVVKTLGPEIPQKKGFMGSSILGDGKPAIIVDLHNLYENNNYGASA